MTHTRKSCNERLFYSVLPLRGLQNKQAAFGASALSSKLALLLGPAGAAVPSTAGPDPRAPPGSPEPPRPPAAARCRGAPWRQRGGVPPLPPAPAPGAAPESDRLGTGQAEQGWEPPSQMEIQEECGEKQ